MVLAEIIRRNARRFPRDLALVFKNNRITFQQYETRVNSLTNALIKLGLRKGERICVILDNCHQFVEIMGAAAKGGFVMAPLSTHLKQELDALVGNAEPRVMIVGDNHADKVCSEWSSLKNIICLGQSREGMLNYENLIAENSTENPNITVSEDDGLFIYYTSGTTGQPKGAYLTNGAVIKGIEEQLLVFSRQYHGEYGIAPHPFYFLDPTICIILPCMYVASPSILQEHFRPQSFLEAVEKEKVTFCVLVPTMIVRLLEDPDLLKYDLTGLRSIAYGSAPMPLEVLKSAQKVFKNVLFAQGYGLTENTSIVTFLPSEDHVTEGPEEIMRRLTSIGYATPNAWVKVVRDDGSEVTPDLTEVGEIIVKCEYLMKEYFNLPELTAETIKDGWLYTGDMAAVDKDGYIYLRERKKDFIISGGVNIYPKEIEEVLYTHPAVSEAAVVGKPNQEWGEVVMAFVSLKPGMSSTPEEIISYTKERVAAYKVPKEVEVMDHLPLTSTGKISKKELRQKIKKGGEKKGQEGSN